MQASLYLGPKIFFQHMTQTQVLQFASNDIEHNNPTILQFIGNFQTDLSNAFDARQLQYCVVRNRPIRLREHSSKGFPRWAHLTLITSPSSSVKVIHCSRSMKSEPILVTQRMDNMDCIRSSKTLNRFSDERRPTQKVRRRAHLE